ncbi:MAG: methyltransferase [Solirubrobacterales bacterium]|nr:methyltransferase [Solirubrobacterales bacterium]
MNADRRAIADELLATAREHDEPLEDRLQRYRVVEPETAELLGLLVRATAARRILEIGTSVGLSTLWLADGAADSGGYFTSVDIDPPRTEQARATLRRARLQADLRTADAATVLAGAPDDSWDLIFLDADRSAYAGYWPDLVRVLRPHGGLLAIDNVLSHPDEVAEIGALIDAEPGITSATLSIGAGLRLVTRGSALAR